MKKLVLTGPEGNLGREIQKLNVFETIGVGRGQWERFNEISPGQVDTVIHCAYDLKHEISKDPTKVLDSNIMSTAKLLELCLAKKITRFVFISSCAVYGDLSNASEDKICQPITMNGHIKLFNENLVQNFCRKNAINCLILRPFNSFGGHDQFSVIFKLIESAKSKKQFTLANKGFAERDFIHVRDIAMITAKLIQMNIVDEVINIGSDQSVKIIDLVNAVEKKFGKLNIKHVENENEAIISKANIKKLKSFIDFQPQSVFDYIDSLS